jgi:Zn-dependent protease
MLDLGPEQIRWIIQAVIILILSICVHEFGHAIIADKLGDSLPRSQGRVSLNPLVHADPIGTVGLPFLAMAFGAGPLGWGRPVEIMPHRMTRKLTVRRAHMLVAAAGPLMNLLLAGVIVLVHIILLKTGVIAADLGASKVPSTIHGALSYAAYINLVLMFFNLVPAPPLDGGSVLLGLVPDRTARKLEPYSVYGPFILMGVIFIPGVSKLFTVPAGWVYEKMADLAGITEMVYAHYGMVG